jgi:hypothetical protein
VSVHPEYWHLIPWNGAERADILYNDANSAFTRMLVNNGLLYGSAWLDATHTYYIEVSQDNDGQLVRCILRE